MNKLLFLLLIIIIISCKSSKSITNSEKENIISELNYIFEIDQKYAGLPSDDLKNKYGNEKAWKIFESKRDSVGIDNQKKVKKLYSKYGYLGFDKIGKEHANKFWITIQHADNDVQFQQKMLKALRKEIDRNNARKSNYAMLEDRIAVNLNKKQRFGSQLTYNNEGQAIPKNGLIDSLNVDKFRLEYDLPSFKAYYNSMTTDHFEMNKENFLKRGIKEPKLY